MKKPQSLISRTIENKGSEWIPVKPSMSMYQLQTLIHSQNVDVGWWDNPRCYSTFTNLFHSEGSEALEGHRKNLNDDKLPQYPMPVVECVDMIVRELDYLGSLGNTKFTEYITEPNYQPGNFQWNLAMCHYWISQAWFAKMMSGEDHEHYLRHAIRLAMHIIEDYEYDPIKIILEKVEFNRTRPDHQRENRQGKTGQKDY